MVLFGNPLSSVQNRPQKTSRNWILILITLYVSQGLPYGFFTQALPVLLRKNGVSLPSIGISTFLTLPWALKFLWAPAVDRYSFGGLGLRRSWLLPVQFASVILFSTIAFLTPTEDLYWVLVAFLFTNGLAAVQDIATDGLAVDLLTERDRGWGNGIQVAAYRIGMIIGGGVLLAIYDRLEWRGVMISMAAIALVCTLPVLQMREPPHILKPAKQFSFAEVFHFLTKPGAWRWAGVLFIYKFGHSAATGMLRPWLVDIGYTMTDIAWILGTAGFIAGFLGAVVGGALATRFAGNRARLLVTVGVFQCLALLTYLWPLYTFHDTTKIVLSTAVDHFTSGLATTVLFTLMMDACSPERAASDYSLQACLVVVSQQVGAAFSGFSAEIFGYASHFLISTVFAVTAVATTWMIVRSAKVRDLLRVAALLVLLLPVFASAQDQNGQNLNGKNAYDFGVQTGILLTKGITGMTEPVPGWALRASTPARHGIFESSVFLGRGNGQSYSYLTLDYRIDLDLYDSQSLLFLIGAHADAYKPIERDRGFSLGWHLGGAYLVPLAGTLGARADFRYRFGPGQAAEILVGFNYRVPASGTR